ncbi:hypothetical protein HHK36_030248 [Tetracentron sinense]|uniref:Uncharacterized protein n=1 Tax=Tetracentron sinense TaxID=13715 RepID=A0A834YD52_TETSI|nr:hypothetical protein HHK36_030248 [Tetracentron sinense]
MEGKKRTQNSLEKSHDANAETITEVGWYILGENQEHVGPYIFSELQDDEGLVELRVNEVPSGVMSRASGLLRTIDDDAHGVEHFLNGYLCEDTLLWSEGRSNWMPLSSIPELFRGISLTRPDYYTAVTSENDEEFVKWQKEVTEAEVEAEVLKHGSASSGVGSDQLKDYEGDANDRPLTPPDGEEEFIDDVGTTYKWDRGLRLWVPQLEDYTFCSDERYKVREMTFLEEEEVFPTLQVADTSVMEEVNGTSEGVEAKLDLKRKLPDKHAEKKEANKPPDSWFDLKVNSHVYVTGLPDDVTAEEDLQLPSIKGAKAKRKKLDDRGEKCIFIGYSEESKAYKLYNPLTNKVVVSRDVIFSEEETWNWDKEEKIKENQIEIEEQEVDHGEQNQENMRQTISTPAPCASSSIVRRSPDARLITPEDIYARDDHFLSVH